MGGRGAPPTLGVVRRRTPLLLLVVSTLVAATGIAAVPLLAATPEPVLVVAPPFAVSGDGDARAVVPVHDFLAGSAIPAALEVFEQPDPPPGTAPVATPSNPTAEGFPLVVSVVEQTPDGAWSLVRLPMRPNGFAGWIRTSDITTWRVPNRIEVTLSTRTLTVYRGTSDEVLFSTDVAIGRPNTPTPLGNFFIDIVNPLGHHPVYGWGQLSVSGFSEVYQRFGGGIGQMALHGWNNDSVMGKAVSNGCIRMRNADIARVAELAPLGTPVDIVA